jgi:peroxiredoxin Q/BCP
MAILEEGKKAPAFKGIDQNGKPVSLADYKEKKLVLYFYPKDSTPTCTVQACNIRDNFSALKKAGIHIIGISADDVKSHKKFEEKHQLPFTIIADTERTIIDKFGVWGEKQLYGKKYMGLLRTSFLINEKGVIVKVIEKPKSKQHAEEILEAWQSVDQ